MSTQLSDADQALVTSVSTELTELLAATAALSTATGLTQSLVVQDIANGLSDLDPAAAITAIANRVANIRLKQEALAKLSDDELAALGLSRG